MSRMTGVSPLKRYRLYVLASSYTLQVLALILFLVERKSMGLPYGFALQFVACMSLSMLSPLLLFFAKGRLFIGAIPALKFAIVAVVGIPLGRNLSIEFLLVAAVILELLFFQNLFLGVVLSVALVVVSALLQRNYFAWNRVVLSPTGLAIVSYAILLAFWLFFGVVARRTVASLLQSIERIRELENDTRKLATVLKNYENFAISDREIAEINERKRITREIHDIIGYTLTNFIVMMESATDFARTDRQKTEELIENARAQAERGLEEIRHSLRLLRIANDNEFQGIRAIHKLTTAFARNTGMSITVEYGNSPWTFNRDLDGVLYSIVQEALINALRHGHASSVKLTFWVHSRELKLNISDNGVGAEAIQEGIGFAGMRERLEPYRGTVIVTLQTGGFQLAISIPLDRTSIDIGEQT